MKCWLDSYHSPQFDSPALLFTTRSLNHGPKQKKNCFPIFVQPSDCRNACGTHGGTAYRSGRHGSYCGSTGWGNRAQGGRGYGCHCRSTGSGDAGDLFPQPIWKSRKPKEFHVFLFVV